MVEPWKLMRHKLGDEIAKLEKKVSEGNATAEDRVRLKKIAAARKASDNERDVLKAKLRAGNATAEEMERLQELDAEWFLVEESPPRSPIPGRERGIMLANMLLEREPCLERVFLHWQTKNDHWANMSDTEKNEQGFLSYREEGYISVFNDFFGKKENWSRLDPDTDQISGLEWSDREAIQSFIEEKREKHFLSEAFDCINWATTYIDDDDTLDWPAVSKLFFRLETAFDPSFYDTGVRHMDGESDNDIQCQVDALLAARQTKMAATLAELDASLALRYLEILREITPPPGLADVEKRGPFVREVERRFLLASIANGQTASTFAAPQGGPNDSYPQRYHRLTVENSNWTQFRLKGIDRLFDLGNRYQAGRTIKVMLLDVEAVGRENAQPERVICEKAKIPSGQIRSPFSESSGRGTLCKEFCDLVIRNDGTRRGLYFLDIV